MIGQLDELESLFYYGFKQGLGNMQDQSSIFQHSYHQYFQPPYSAQNHPQLNPFLTENSNDFDQLVEQPSQNQDNQQSHQIEEQEYSYEFIQIVRVQQQQEQERKCQHEQQKQSLKHIQRQEQEKIVEDTANFVKRAQKSYKQVQIIGPYAKCPKIGISKQQILKKKLALQMRKTTQWKIPKYKQPRQLRMLRK